MPISLPLQIRTNLILFKVCADELGYNETICGDPTGDPYKEIENIIQSRANRYFLVEQWLTSAPGVIYALFIGSLSDGVIGRKPLLVATVFGNGEPVSTYAYTLSSNCYYRPATDVPLRHP